VAAALVLVTAAAGVVGHRAVLDRRERQAIRAAHEGTRLPGTTTRTQWPPEPPATCTNAPPGWADAESVRPGADGLPPASQPVVNGPVVGYLDQTSVQCGQSIGLHLSGTAPGRVQVAALRVGAYLGARPVSSGRPRPRSAANRGHSPWEAGPPRSPAGLPP
jgi:hypothetical protein